jgi:hypothetical protein
VDRVFQVSTFNVVKPAIIPRCCVAPYRLSSACESFGFEVAAT